MSKRSEDDSYSNANIPGFLSKTYEIFSSPEFEDICSWGPGGDTIIVKKIDEFSKVVLPKFFKHSNFQSFVRQLNMYDFHKTVQDPSHGEFQHKHFLRDRPDLLHLIKRKAHARSTTESKKRPLDNAQVNELRSESGAIMNEMIQLRKMKDDIESRLSDMEYKQSQLMAENAMLKHTMEQSMQKQELMKQKMQRILYFMYEMYVNSARGPTGSRRLEGSGGLNAITNLGENYAEAMRLLDLEPSTIRPIELAHHPAVEDLASTGAPTPRSMDGAVDPSNNFPAFGTVSGEPTRLASFDTGAASVVPPNLPFGRVLSIEAPPVPQPGMLDPVPDPVISANPGSNPGQQPAGGASLRRMYSVIPDEDPQLSKRPRTRDQAAVAGPPNDLQAELSSWTQNQDNLMTRIDSLDATLSQLLDSEDLGLDSLSSIDDSYLSTTEHA